MCAAGCALLRQLLASQPTAAPPHPVALPWPPPRRVPEECPAEVVQLIYRCIDPDPGARPTSTEVAEALLQAAALPWAGSGAAPRDGGAAASPFSEAAAAAVGSPPTSGEQPPQPQHAAVASRAGSGRPPRPGSCSLHAVLEDEIVAEAMAELRAGSAPMHSDSRLYTRGSSRSRSATGQGPIQRRFVLPASASASPFRSPQASAGGEPGAPPAAPPQPQRPPVAASLFQRRPPGHHGEFRKVATTTGRQAIAPSPFRRPQFAAQEGAAAAGTPGTPTPTPSQEPPLHAAESNAES